MNIDNVFMKKKPVLSFEIFPPKRDTTLKSVDETLEVLSCLNPDFISVTFGAGGSAVNNLTLELCKKIKTQFNIEPVMHLACINQSKEDIDTILGEMNQAGLDNILALRGDRNPDIEPKHDFAYAKDLIDYIKTKGDFHISAACYPEGHLEAESKKLDIEHLKEKVDAGATHLISQLFFDNEYFYYFRDNARRSGINVPIEAGIMPVTNTAQIQRMTNLCGASIPARYLRIMDKYSDNKEALMDAGIAFAISQIVDLIANDVDGIHVYTMNNPVIAKRICDSIKNLV